MQPAYDKSYFYDLDKSLCSALDIMYRRLREQVLTLLLSRHRNIRNRLTRLKCNKLHRAVKREDGAEGRDCQWYTRVRQTSSRISLVPASRQPPGPPICHCGGTRQNDDRAREREQGCGLVQRRASWRDLQEDG